MLPFTAQPATRQASQASHATQAATAGPDDLMREAEAQRALAELFPHLKLNALRAIQDLFPLQAARKAALH